MKKKFLTVLMSVFAISTCLFALTACVETPHKHSFNPEVVSPTCTEQGYTKYTCECEETYNDNYVNALGHNYGEPSYAWNGNSCTATKVCSNDNTHVVTQTVTGLYVKDSDANCTTAETGHYVATFTNSAFATQTTANGSAIIGEPLGHNYEGITYVWDNFNHTCTATATCSNDTAHVVTETVTGVYVKDADATCTTLQYGHYVATFTNSAFETQNSANVTSGVAFGHNFGQPTYTWEGDVCTATRVCSHDNTHLDTETATVEYFKDSDANCTTAETGHYVATFTNSEFETQTTANGSAIIGEPLDHNFDEPTYVWDDENHTCTATRVCLTDSTHVETETVTAVYVITREANCNYPERGNYRATFTNKAFKTQNAEKFNTGEPLGHSFTNYESDNNATLNTNCTETAICDREGCEETHTRDIENSKLESQVKLAFIVNDVEDFDINNAITLNSQVSIKVLVGGQLTTENIMYKVVRLDIDPANNYGYTITDGTFTAGFVGTYEIIVYYVDGETEIPSATYTLNVIANIIENARVINTFSNSTSVVAAYSAEDKQTMVEGTTWYKEYNGKYGVISTVGQTYNTSYSAFYLRSADYDTREQMESAGLAKTLFGTEKEPTDDGYFVGFNCENWDYLSIKVYFAKPEGVEDNTLNVYYGDHSNKGDILTVNYNEWTELKIDKGMLLSKLCNAGRLLQQYSTANDDAHKKPMFYADSANVGTVYFDSMSFEKYTEYKHFAEFYYEDTISEQQKVKVSKDAIYLIDDGRGEVVLPIKIKLEQGDSDYLTIPTVKSGANFDGTSANIVVDYYDAAGSTSKITRDLQDASGKKVSYTSSYFYYCDRSKFNVPCQLSLVNITANTAATVCLKYIYTHTDGTKYVGYLATKIKFVA